MTAVEAPPSYLSGFCASGRHERCRGDFGSAVCCCACHQEPPESEPEVRGLRIGSLFSGYGGLEQGVQSVLGGTVAWHSEIDPGACKILAHRYPDVPNLGDITAVDWAAVEPVDVLTGGFPCQDVSAAGKRAGIAPGTRSGLWAEMARAIQALRPPLVVIENVRGLLSADAHHPAHGDLEPCPWCLGDDEPVLLRALGAVLGDLADIGFNAEWTGLRAADAGAPHGRCRVFVVAWPAEYTERAGLQGGALRCMGRAEFPPARRALSVAYAHGGPVWEQPVTFTGRSGAAVAGHAGADAAADADQRGQRPHVADLRTGEPDADRSTPADADGTGFGWLEELHAAPGSRVWLPRPARR